MRPKNVQNEEINFFESFQEFIFPVIFATVETISKCNNSIFHFLFFVTDYFFIQNLLIFYKTLSTLMRWPKLNSVFLVKRVCREWQVLELPRLVNCKDNKLYFKEDRAIQPPHLLIIKVTPA
jgi:hypothetical protein